MTLKKSAVSATVRKTVLKLVCLGLLSFQMVSSAYASDDDDYNFSWLDPDKKIYVLQNRKFRKAGHAQISLMGGTSLGETYRTVYQVQPRIGTWFSEEFGIEGFYSARFNSVNNAYRALDNAINTSGVTKSPYIREIKSEIGVLLNWAPWYAKINVFNTILYFDWYFSLGAGTMQTQIGPKTIDDPVAGSSWKSESLFAFYAGTGQMFHISEHFFGRLDVLGRFYSASVFGGAPGAPTDSTLFSNFTFSLGVGVKI